MTFHPSLVWKVEAGWCALAALGDGTSGAPAVDEDERVVDAAGRASLPSHDRSLTSSPIREQRPGDPQASTHARVGPGPGGAGTRLTQAALAL
ncbi:MAG TPA: hypothetical protein VKT82_15650 [Ktedonobacterales bacterium]|nr:hypothetical protein [Ktedonobacterales bacterium]